MIREKNNFNKDINGFFGAKKYSRYRFFSNKFKKINFNLLMVVLVSGLAGHVSSARGEQPPAPILPNVKRPLIDPGRVKERLATEEAPQDFIESKKILVPVKKEHIISEQQKAERDLIKFKLISITCDGVTVYKKGELAKYYKSYLGKDISLSDLQSIADAITAHYRKDGYMISRAVVPAQQVKSGQVHIQVVEGYIAEVYIEGDVDKVRAKIEKYAEKIKQMRPLQIEKLERYGLLLNDISGLVVKSVLSPSLNAVGAADLTFIVEQKRVNGGVYYDNRGSRYLGPGQLFANIAFGDAIWAGDTLTLQTIDTPVCSELRYLLLDYSYPFGTSGLSVSANGAFTETRPGFVIESADLTGRSKNWGVVFDYALLRSRAKNFWLSGKFDWLDSQTDYSTATVGTLFRDHIRSVRFAASYDFIDRLRGANLISVELARGLKIFGASPLNPGTPLTRINGRSDYTKINMNLSRYQALGERTVLLGAVTGQYSFDEKLLSAEQFSFGGPQYGRAYAPSEMTGDAGVAGKLELRFNTYPDWRYLQQIQYYTYYDIGAIWNVGGVDFYKAVARDSGADLGVGLRVTFDSHFYGNLELVQPLTRKADELVAAGKDGNLWRLYFGFGVKI